jgi:hypothetical protein
MNPTNNYNLCNKLANIVTYPFSALKSLFNRLVQWATEGSKPAGKEATKPSNATLKTSSSPIGKREVQEVRTSYDDLLDAKLLQDVAYRLHHKLPMTLLNLLSLYLSKSDLESNATLRDFLTLRADLSNASLGAGEIYVKLDAQRILFHIDPETEGLAESLAQASIFYILKTLNATSKTAKEHLNDSLMCGSIDKEQYEVALKVVQDAPSDWKTLEDVCDYSDDMTMHEAFVALSSVRREEQRGFGFIPEALTYAKLACERNPGNLEHLGNLLLLEMLNGKDIEALKDIAAPYLGELKQLPNSLTILLKKEGPGAKFAKMCNESSPFSYDGNLMNALHFFQSGLSRGSYSTLDFYSDLQNPFGFSSNVYSEGCLYIADNKDVTKLALLALVAKQADDKSEDRLKFAIEKVLGANKDLIMANVNLSHVWLTAAKDSGIELEVEQKLQLAVAKHTLGIELTSDDIEVIRLDFSSSRMRTRMSILDTAKKAITYLENLEAYSDVLDEKFMTQARERFLGGIELINFVGKKFKPESAEKMRDLFDLLDAILKLESDKGHEKVIEVLKEIKTDDLSSDVTKMLNDFAKEWSIDLPDTEESDDDSSDQFEVYVPN